MKYWILTSEYPPQYGGGIGTYSYHLAQLLNAKGVDVSVFILDRNVENVQDEIKDGVRLIRFSPYLSDTAGVLGYDAMVSYSFSSVVEMYLEKEGKPDCVEAHEYNGIAYYLLQKKHVGYPLLQDLKVVITCHCPSFILLPYNHNSVYTLPGYWLGEMEKFCIESADLCFSPSRYLINSLSEAGIERTDIAVLPNPYVPTAQSVDATAKTNNILFIGKVSIAKGIIELLDAMKVLAQENSNIKLTIVGDADFYHHSRKKLMAVYLKEKYSDLFDSGKVELMGIVSASKVEQIIKESSLLVMPSKMENFPYVVLETMYLGTPVLASITGGQQEIIEESINGFLYDTSKGDNLAKKIKTILNTDAAKISVLKNEAKKLIEKEYNAENHFRRKMELITNFKVTTQNLFPFSSIINAKSSTIGLNDESQPLLSVIIPFYNLGKYVKETIDAVKSSNYKNLEIIIVDDGSTDTLSKQVLNELSSDPSIKIIHQPNQGLSNTRNIGAAHANGDFITFLDADDKVHEDYFTKAIKTLTEKDNVHFVGSWIKYFEGSNGTWPSFTPVFPYIFYHNMLNSSSLVYKKESFCNAGFNDEIFVYGMEDYESVINMMANGYNGVVLPEFLFYYRVRKDSMSKGFNDTNQKYLYELIAKKHELTMSKFTVSLYGLLTANGPGYKIDNPTKSSATYSSNGFLNSKARWFVEKAKRNPRIRSVVLKLMSKRG